MLKDYLYINFSEPVRAAIDKRTGDGWQVNSKFYHDACEMFNEIWSIRRKIYHDFWPTQLSINLTSRIKRGL